MQSLNATDVRKNWGQFIDDVVRYHPKVVKRSRDYFLAISIQHLIPLTENFHFHVDYYTEEDSTVTASLREIDLVANGNSKQEAKDMLARELLEYAEEYWGDFATYFNSPNRRAHFPYVLKVLIQDDLQGIVRLLNA